MDNIEKSSIQPPGIKLTLLFGSMMIRECISQAPCDNILYNIKKRIGQESLFLQIYKKLQDYIYKLIETDDMFYEELSTFDYREGFSDKYLEKLEISVSKSIKDITLDAEILTATIVI
jgi:hypothetical protein